MASYGRPIGEEDVAYKLPSGLPDEYRALRTALMEWRTDSLKLEVGRISSAILTEEKSIRPFVPDTPPVPPYAHVAHSTPSSTPLQPQFEGRRFERRRDPYAKCTFCKSNGHYEAACFLKFPELHPNHPNHRPEPNDRPIPAAQTPAQAAAVVHHDPPAPDKPLQELMPKSEYNYTSSTLANVGNGSLDWLLDSGCSAHYTKWPRCYREYRTLKKPIPVGTGGGTILGLATGVVPLDLECGTVLLAGVIFTPTLNTNCNMLSITLLDSLGFSTLFSDGRAYITRRADNVLWATGTQRGASLYFLDLISTTSGKFKPDSEASLVDRPRYQSAIGCLLYLSIGSRPDITFAGTICLCP